MARLCCLVVLTTLMTMSRCATPGSTTSPTPSPADIRTAETKEFGPDKDFCVDSMGENSTKTFEDADFTFDKDKDDKQYTFKCKDGRQEFSCEDDCTARMSFVVSDEDDTTRVTIEFGGAVEASTKVKIVNGDTVVFEKDTAVNETLAFNATKGSQVDMWEVSGIMFLYSISLEPIPANPTKTAEPTITRERQAESPVTYVTVIIIVLAVLILSRLYVSCKKTIDKRRGVHGFQELHQLGQTDDEDDFLADEELDIDAEYRN